MSQRRPPLETLRRAREREGLSQRALAERMGLSWVTVNQAEKGRDIRHSTLQAYLRALPALAPDDLLRPSRRARVGSRDLARNVYRTLFGFEASEVSKTVTITPHGDSATVIETSGLRSLRGDMRDLSILVGLQRAVVQGSGSVLQSIEAKTESFTTRVVERRDGRAVHQFTFPRRLAQAGITYRRHLATKGLYLLTAARAASKHGLPGPYCEGATSPVSHPIHVLRVVVNFPGRYWPKQVRAVVWPMVQVPDPELPDLSALLHPEGLSVRRSLTENALVLRVERPVVGLKYGMAWTLP